MCTKYEANNYMPVYISTGCFGLLAFFPFQPEMKAAITDLFEWKC